MATVHRTRALAPFFAALVAGLCGAPAGLAGEPAPFTAREGEPLAVEAARAWSDDARLIWIENDEAVIEAGTSPRWSYLFYSPSRDAARGYSVRDREVKVTEDLAFDFPAPPVEGEWMDSARALAIADEEHGARFRRDTGGHLRSMVLVRGILHVDTPDAITWAVVYEADGAPGLWVVVDAASGKVVRTWRG